MNYISNLEVSPYLQHYGILGMHWGVRRYQNADGSLTAAGKNRYGDVGDSPKKSTNSSASGVSTSTNSTAKKVAKGVAITAASIAIAYGTYKLGSKAIRSAAISKSNKAAKQLIKELSNNYEKAGKTYIAAKSALRQTGNSKTDKELEDIVSSLSADYYRAMGELSDTNRYLDLRNERLNSSVKSAAQYLFGKDTGNWNLRRGVNVGRN